MPSTGYLYYNPATDDHEGGNLLERIAAHCRIPSATTRLRDPRRRRRGGKIDDLREFSTGVSRHGERIGDAYCARCGRRTHPQSGPVPRDAVAVRVTTTRRPPIHPPWKTAVSEKPWKKAEYASTRHGSDSWGRQPWPFPSSLMVSPKPWPMIMTMNYCRGSTMRLTNWKDVQSWFSKGVRRRRTTRAWNVFHPSPTTPGG